MGEKRYFRLVRWIAALLGAALLAGLPGIRNKERLGNEARDECNATLLKGSS